MTTKYRSVIIIVMITVLSFLTVDMFYKVVSSKITYVGAEASLPEKAAARKIVKKPSTGSYGVIAERNLFGSGGSTAEESDINVEELERTELNLSLLGTVTGGKGLDYAVIKEKNKREQALFRAGDEVAGATINKIMRGAVVLRVENRDEVLLMEESKSGPGVTREERAAVSFAGSEIKVKKDEIDDALQDMSKILTEARIRPYFTAGEPDGFMISRIKHGSIFQKMGMRNGDIIQGVNNEPIQSPDDMLELYKGLKSGSEITINVKRRGKQEDLQYVFE
jgi:general secretion pathway protein C